MGFKRDLDFQWFGYENSDPHTSSDEEENDDSEPIRAPLQLMTEFVNSIMFRRWTVAKKLCHFVLMYEPDNKEAKQFQPLIDYMLKKEEEKGSSSSSSDDDDDTGTLNSY
ncbi:unnamed protein product [Didymodactylos carnosus]|uniref:Uncharacterized protein n=1 Tax=Didymodactylos carnosus TaxID=1234261 RepID=A0A814CJW8_9BILA|nr:unnamed protein product [Didymodactylos carnosus]CAF3717699.1 unnamed protein product [Didymodactylos carnosus]